MSVEPVHAGLECGSFSSANPALDIISIGPDILDIHSPRETLVLDTVYGCDTLIRAILKDSPMLERYRGHRVQDALSIRCMPQLHGPVKKAIKDAQATLAIELNSSVDNPLIFDEEDGGAVALMGYNAAKKAYDSMHLAKYILAAELICDGQALDCYEDKRCAKGTQAIYDLLRSKVPEMDNDMPLTPYLEAVAQQIIDGAYIRTVEASVGALKF